MHMASHVDDWCKKNCDPKNFKELNDVIILTYIYPLHNLRIIPRSFSLAAINTNMNGVKDL